MTRSLIALVEARLRREFRASISSIEANWKSITPVELETIVTLIKVAEEWCAFKAKEKK